MARSAISSLRLCGISICIFIHSKPAYASDVRDHGSQAVVENIELKTVILQDILGKDVVDEDLPHFNSSVLHYEWVTAYETGPLGVANRAMKGKKKDGCIAFDCGMNDGFYTQLSAAYGCQVYSFDVQPKCIAIATHISRLNGFSDLTNIMMAPLGEKNNVVIPIAHGGAKQLNTCDGGYTLTKEGVGQVAYEVVGHRHLNSVALSSFVPRNMKIDFLKIDVEMLESIVLAGAEDLFRRKQIVRAVVEIGSGSWSDVYIRIMDYGYKMGCVTLALFPGTSRLSMIYPAHTLPHTPSCTLPHTLPQK